MKNKGFTLIELIAVITILAVIAFITVPIITNFIDESEAGSTERSAQNYIKAVNDTLLAKKINTDIEDGRYLITDGNLCPQSEGTNCPEPILVKVDGTIPTSGYVDIEDLRVVKTTSQVEFEDYTVAYDDVNKKYVATKTGDKNNVETDKEESTP